MVVVR